VAASIADLVVRHLALVAVDGAGASVAETLHPAFRLHLDDFTTGASGYLALIEARWAAEGARPPLDVTSASSRPASVSVAIEPRCTVEVRIEGGLLAEMWITS